MDNRLLVIGIDMENRLADVESIHRQTINRTVEKKRDKGYEEI